MKAALYARVSTHEQDVTMQLMALREYCQARGIEVFNEYIDHGVSGTQNSRPLLDQMMDDARKRKFDAVVVYRFDRFARSSRHLIMALEEFDNLDIAFISYQENIDTASPLGKAVFVIVGAMAELERNIIVERVKSGLQKAKAQGKKLGRPATDFDLEEAQRMREQGKGLRSIADRLGVSKSTLSRALQSHSQKQAA